MRLFRVRTPERFVWINLDAILAITFEETTQDEWTSIQRQTNGAANPHEVAVVLVGTERFRVIEDGNYQQLLDGLTRG